MMKPGDILDDQEVETIRECLDAAIAGPFFADAGSDDPWWEFHTLMGVSRGQMAQLAEWWPDVDVDDEQVRRAINMVLVHLLSYPHKCWGVWSDYIPVPPPEILRVLKKWRSQLGAVDGKIPNDFFNMYGF